MPFLLFALKNSLLGLAVGIISASLGLGGGILMVPAFLTFNPGMDAHTAKGTSLCVIIFVAAANAWRLNKHFSVPPPWRLAAWLSTGAIVGSYSGVWITSMLSERMVLGIFLVLMLFLSLRTFLLQQVHVDRETPHSRAVPLSIGFAAGLAGGATGIGGGGVLVPLVLYAGLITNERVSGLSNMVMVCTCTVGALAHLQATSTYPMAGVWGQLYLPLVPFVVLGAQVGSRFGIKLNTWLTLPRRRIILGGLLLIIAARILYRLLP